MNSNVISPASSAPQGTSRSPDRQLEPEAAERGAPARAGKSRVLAMWLSPEAAQGLVEVCGSYAPRVFEFDIVPVAYLETEEALKTDKLIYPIVLVAFSKGDSVCPTAEGWLESWTSAHRAAGSRPIIVSCETRGSEIPEAGDTPWHSSLDRLVEKSGAAVIRDTRVLRRG
ncbi:MAG: hypothetical protein WD342_05775 [Verrucomicrobiales bacterium]